MADCGWTDHILSGHGVVRSQPRAKPSVVQADNLGHQPCAQYRGSNLPIDSHYKGAERDAHCREAIVFGTVLVSSYRFDTGIIAKVASYIGIFASAVGLILYIASGILT
jgi:hypothetical protein